MPDYVTEALLEMHYHHAIVDMFATTFGANFVRLLKPSSVEEAWLGFDQGWVRTVIPQTELTNMLRQEIH